MTRPPLRAAACAAAALVLAGCAKAPPAVVPAAGVVLLNGQPLPNAEVQFVPTEAGLGMQYIATATTDDKGRFELTCNGQSGACACANRVTVVDSSIPERIRGKQTEEAKYLAGLKNRPIPDQYANLARTPVVVTVTPGQTEYVVELKR
ncbi:MAG TPA: hypothetical protein VH092_28665 [Urbifossiella sp.]|jgi:hypothetical protein|nr:hypothetical protein [Urbifossiella sp.]